MLIDEKPFRSFVANKSLKPNPGNEHERNRTSATQCSLQQSQMTGTSSGFSSAWIDTVYGLIHTLKCGVFWLNSSFVITSELQRQRLKKARQCCERTGAASGAFFLTPLKRRVRFIRGAFRRLRNLSPPFSSIHTFNTSNTPGCWKTNNARFCSFLHDGQLFPSASEGAASTCITRHITAWCNTLTSSSSSNKFKLS